MLQSPVSPPVSAFCPVAVTGTSPLQDTGKKTATEKGSRIFSRCLHFYFHRIRSVCPQRSASNILFPVLQEIPDPFAADRISELSQCFRLDLADTLSRYVELFSNFFQSSRMSVFKTESKNDDLTFSLFEITK